MENVTESHVAVKPSLVSGNGLFATRSLPAGELVLQLKRPLVGVLDTPRLEDTCSNCFAWSSDSDGNDMQLVLGNSTAVTATTTVNACVGCRKVKYCSKRCQSQAWKREHKFNCKLLKSLPTLPSAVRAARELAVLMDSEATSAETKQAVMRMEERTLDSAPASADDRAADKRTGRAAFRTVADVTRQILARENPQSAALKLSNSYVGKIFRNSLTLITSTFDPLGLVFDPLICTANHSCNPNAVVVMDGSIVSLRSLAPIAKDEEITITYIDNTNPYSIRQAELRERYSFDCRCSKCTKGPTQREDQWLQPPSKFPANFEKVHGVSYPEAAVAEDQMYFVGASPEEQRLSALQSHVFNALDHARESKDLRAATSQLESLMRLCRQSALWPPTRQPYVAARNELFANLLSTGDFVEAMYHLVKIYFSIDPALYPQPFHPVRVVHSWTLVKLLLWLYEQRDHPATKQFHESGFDFVVVIWKLLRQLKAVVVLSHGNGGFKAMVDGLYEEVRREILGGGGELALRSLERDELRQWDAFRSLENVLDF